MGNFVRQLLHLFARPRRLPDLTSLFALVAVGAFWLPQTSAFGSVLKHEESPSSRILYLTESGGLITSNAKPVPGSEREPMPPLAAPSAKVTPKATPKATPSRRPTTGKGLSTRKSLPDN